MNPASVVDLYVPVYRCICMASAIRALTLTNARIFIISYNIHTRVCLCVVDSVILLFTSSLFFLSFSVYRLTIILVCMMSVRCVWMYVFGLNRATFIKHGVMTNYREKKGIEIKTLFEKHRTLWYTHTSKQSDIICRTNRIQCGATTHGVSDTDSQYE